MRKFKDGCEKSKPRFLDRLLQQIIRLPLHGVGLIGDRLINSPIQIVDVADEFHNV